ncbi:rhomboid family intramembrane serine protease [Flavobacterium zepuense]|uniref:Rhomboid family intramembrane serine protease n=1 Tax=Flavobacterium zepuense TaxID=2593302 RepID=A0A552V2L8_9FLAO|nr:rhomboid family intramembrane serine protease [Flavobacterium zepuense]TRW24714.1 rhomboid family intramembrane serine protease [Flavobacterium zepuense]
MMRITETVKQLIIINIIFFVGSWIVGQPAVDILALHAPQNDKFQFWQLITHMFMHGGIMHIAFNMFALFSFGGLLEQMWGAKKFIFFYVSCGLGSAALHLGVNYFEMQHVLADAVNLNLSHDTLHQILNVDFSDGTYFRGDLFQAQIEPILAKAGKINLVNDNPGSIQSLYNAAAITQSPMLGASGAIYGLLVAFAFMFPEAPLMLMFIPFPIKAKYFVPGVLAIDLFLGLKGQSIFGFGSDGVAHFAHLGGALLGFIMMWYWKKNAFNNNRWN